jgi:hypothetical protein
MLMDADARLAAAAGGVARFFADAAGLENSAIAPLQSTVIAACTEAFEHLTFRHPQLEVHFGRFADRIEIALSYEGKASPAEGQDIPEQGPGSAAFAGVDRVQYEAHGGGIITRLTKYLDKDSLNQ